MIGFLRGRLVAKQPPRLVLDVNGVGYEVEAPMSTIYELPAIGSEVTLLTHLLVREDAHILYGFASEAERTLFRSLLKVSGVGSRTALAILSGITAEAFARCIQEGDVALLTKVPGIGRKTAERLLVEMRDRIAAQVGAGTGAGGAAGAAATSPEGEAYGALVALGYKPAEVSRMLKQVNTPGLSTEELIRQILKNLA
ncbi:MAG: Holliday junction branch migration protein RuvA [Gammaproteobacteria bacterium]|nr:Holliday junction branch migration protein RuvA [Gammaproteobacteria bacterium]